MSEKNEKKQPLFVDESYITGDSCLFTVTNAVERGYARTKLGAIRQELMQKLNDEGFEIITDKYNVPCDAIYLTMNDIATCDENVKDEIWKKEFDKKIFEAGGEKLNYPKSLKMEEFFENPFFPVVLKNEFQNGGKDKFLIETDEQLQIIKNFYYDHINDNNYKKIFDLCIFQHYITTPTNYKTYMRVLMSASGDVMGASLKYSLVRKTVLNELGPLQKHFCDSSSKYFLDSKQMFGYYSGGESIFFGLPYYGYEKRKILKAHGIDEENPQVPQDVLEVSKAITQKCNNMLGVMCGIDFIQDETDKKWYYLENQAFPAIDEWAVIKGIKLPKQRGIEGYLKLLEIEKEARYEALTLLMNKRKK